MFIKKFINKTLNDYHFEKSDAEKSGSQENDSESESEKWHQIHDIIEQKS